MKLHNFGSHPLHIQFQLHLVVISALAGAILYFVEIVNPAFTFGGSRLGLAAHPLQFLFKKLLRLSCFGGFVFYPRVAFF